jgi:LPS sulfotransferase NodH
MDTSRTEEFSRNIELEDLLKSLNSSLMLAEQDLLEQTGKKEPYPLLLIMGPHRSGTTLFLQWLANTGIFAYPTNLLSRFYLAPILGAKIQLLLTDPRYNYRDELVEYTKTIEYMSDNGKTKGVLAPNEFWYFWRSFLPAQDRDVWTDQELMNNMDYTRLVKELKGITEIMEKPFAAKAMLFNYNIPFLDKILDKVIFVHMKRDEAANSASALDARKRQFGSEKAWYSFIIPEYEALQNLDPVHQVVGQIRAINRAVEKGFKKVADFRKMTVQYEEFCDSPEKIFLQLTHKLAQQGMTKKFKYYGPDNFKPTRTSDIDPRIINLCATGH